MSVYVMRDGKLVEKSSTSARSSSFSSFPSPRISRIEAFESPITGEQISSWRQRDRDMNAADAVDPRDLPRKPFEQRRKKRHERSIIEAAQRNG
jgi:hypothetical protein